MTPARLLHHRATLRMTRAQLAAHLGRGEGTLRQWEAGTVRIPDDVANWLENLAGWFAINPPPQRKSASDPAPDTL